MNFRAMVFLALAAVQAASGVRISGRVVDGETGKPVIDAIVTLAPATGKEPPRTVTSGPNGTFQFLNIPKGAYQLHTEHAKPTIPYRSESIDIQVADRNLEDLGLLLTPALTKVPVKGKVVMNGGGVLPTAISVGGDAIPIASDGSFEFRMRPLVPQELSVTNPAEAYFIDSVSTGTWDPVRGLWMIRENPGAAVQIAVVIGRQKISGRVLNAKKAAAPQATLSLLGPAPEIKTRPLTLTATGEFSIGGLRPGMYVLQGKTGAGDATEAASMKFTVDASSVAGVELNLKPLTLIKGQLILSGRTLEELSIFKPYVEVEDALGRRQVNLDKLGAFEFRSFDNDFTVSLRSLPIEIATQSIEKGPGTVSIHAGPSRADGPQYLPLERLR
jgi:hypothetical protein